MYPSDDQLLVQNVSRKPTMIGQTISHYKILEKLGGGGMGVVYKAEDTTLKRTVALKFLPPELTLDPESKERFIHEAQAASTLDHLNICTIYEVNQTNEGQMFIAMACYEGDTLKSRIAKGPLRIEDAVDLAIQIAQGLQKAHEKRIVHRDVKPANIIVTSDGVAKIVDFGLAKLSGASKLTKTGSTLGTVAYMSPEQLQGSDVDARADIFSLGVVLFEMLTGKTPFRGDHEAALMYSILSEEPEPLQNLVPDVSAELIHIVARALEKSPDGRYKTMDDLLIDLRRLRKETSKVSMPIFRRIGGRGFAWRRAALIGLGVIVVAVLAIVFILPSPRKMPQLNPDSKTVALPLPVSQLDYPFLSSDGNWIAVAGRDSNGKGDLYYMNASGGEARCITKGDSCSYGRVGGISNDGAWLACQRVNKGKKELALVPVLGGKAQTVCPIQLWPIWSIDNQRLFSLGKDVVTESGKMGWRAGVWSVKRDGSDKRYEFIEPGIGGIGIGFSLSPDGKSIAWITHFRDFSEDIISHNLESGHESRITYTKSLIDEVFWTKDNFIIYSSNKTGNFELYMCPAEGGESIQITRSASANVYGQLSADGRRLLYYQYKQVGNIKILNLESGKVSAITTDDMNKEGLSISPDNQQLTFTQPMDWGYNTAVFGLRVIDRNKRESALNLVSDVGTASATAWSPDGQWIAFIARPKSVDEPSKICIVSPSSPASFKVIGDGAKDTSGFAANIFVWWLDNHTLEWTIPTKDRVEAPRQVKTFMSSIENPNPQQFYDDSTRAYPIQGGKYVLFLDHRLGRDGWWIDMSPGATNAGSRTTKRILGREYVSIAPDGKFLLCRNSNGELQKVSLPDGKVQPLPFRVQNTGVDIGPDGIGAISRDGKELAYIEYVTSEKLVLMENPFIWK